MANTYKQLFVKIHKSCIGLQVSNLNYKSYGRLLVTHLVSLVKTPTENPLLRNRAIIILLTLLFTSATVTGIVTYSLVKLVNKLKIIFSNRRNGRPMLRRTRSQVQLETGARILYLPDDGDINGSGSNDIVTNIKGAKKVKKIVIPPMDKDVYDHDKFLYKNVELDKFKISQLFYSKFLSQLNVISKILIPSVLDKNFVLLVLQIFFLVMRTYLSLFIARLDGQIVRDIISGRSKKFIIDIGFWFLIAFPASYTNSAIKLLQRKLSLNFRVNLTRYIHDIYLDKKLSFYKLIFDQRASSSVIKNIDNSITNDVTKFCDASTSVFANIAKPVIDLVFFSIYLRDNIGSLGVGGIFVNYFITGLILKTFTPPLGKLASSTSKADGNYYTYHLNLINNSEEIAFYQGTTVEKGKVLELYNTLMDKMLLMDRSKFNYNCIEDYILKYTWSGLGYVFASIPIVVTTISSGVNSEESNMKEFIVNKRLMLNLADAGSRLMHSIKDISQLTGYTNRIFTLLSVLHRVHSNDFAYGANALENSDIRGTVQRNFRGIRLENIDVVIPSIQAQNGAKLIKKLTFQIPTFIDLSSSKTNSVQDLTTFNNKNTVYDMMLPFINGPGSSLLILGPNSCGKSSIQRIIAEIWPVYNKNGLLSIPAENNLICIPQRPYFTRGGTLRDQIIYPMSSDEFFDRGLKDKMLVQILNDVKLEYLLKRDRGWSYLDAAADWKDVLSGGEKQRMNFARIMFHKPRFVVLDEATNAISIDMEDYLFNLLKRYRFNFISISQRPSLIKYHDLLLEVSEDKEGSWNLQTLGTEEAITSIDNEIEELEKKLENVKKWELERQELQNKLAII